MSGGNVEFPTGLLSSTASIGTLTVSHVKYSDGNTIFNKNEDGRIAFSHNLAITNVDIKTLSILGSISITGGNTILQMSGGNVEFPTGLVSSAATLGTLTLNTRLFQLDPLRRSLSIGHEAALSLLGDANTVIALGGRHANSQYCVFIGSMAGTQDPNVVQTSMISHAIGIGLFSFYFHTGSIEHCTSIGSYTGNEAVSLARSCCMGYQAGSKANSDDSIYIGYRAGRKVTGPNNIFIGAGDDTGISTSNTLRIGSLIEGTMLTTAESSLTINSQLLKLGTFEMRTGQGNLSIIDPTGDDVSGSNMSSSVSIGPSVRLDSLTSCVLVGVRTGTNIRSDYGIAPRDMHGTVAIGFETGRTRYNCNESVIIGRSAGSYAWTASNAVMIGNHAGESSHGIYNTFIGDYAGNTWNGNYTLAIGRDQLYATAFDGQSTDYRLAIGMHRSHSLLEGVMGDTNASSELTINAGKVCFTNQVKIEPATGSLAIFTFVGGAWVEGVRVDGSTLSTGTLKLSNVQTSADGAGLDAGTVYRDGSGYLKIA